MSKEEDNNTKKDAVSTIKEKDLSKMSIKERAALFTHKDKEPDAKKADSKHEMHVTKVPTHITESQSEQKVVNNKTSHEKRPLSPQEISERQRRKENAARKVAELGLTQGMISGIKDSNTQNETKTVKVEPVIVSETKGEAKSALFSLLKPNSDQKTVQPGGELDLIAQLVALSEKDPNGLATLLKTLEELPEVNRKKEKLLEVAPNTLVDGIVTVAERCSAMEKKNRAQKLLAQSREQAVEGFNTPNKKAQEDGKEFQKPVMQRGESKIQK